MYVVYYSIFTLNYGCNLAALPRGSRPVSCVSLNTNYAAARKRSPSTSRAWHPVYEFCLNFAIMDFWKIWCLCSPQIFEVTSSRTAADTEGHRVFWIRIVCVSIPICDIEMAGTVLLPSQCDLVPAGDVWLVYRYGCFCFFIYFLFFIFHIQIFHFFSSSVKAKRIGHGDVRKYKWLASCA